MKVLLVKKELMSKEGMSHWSSENRAAIKKSKKGRYVYGGLFNVELPEEFVTDKESFLEWLKAYISIGTRVQIRRYYKAKRGTFGNKKFKKNKTIAEVERTGEDKFRIYKIRPLAKMDFWTG